MQSMKSLRNGLVLIRVSCEMFLKCVVVEPEAEPVATAFEFEFTVEDLAVDEPAAFRLELLI
jgi:hypothetical protein